MSTHLYRRQGGTYYFRRIIPASRRSAFNGKREWIVSLRTKDREQAKRSLPAMVAAFDAAMLTVCLSTDAIPNRTPETPATAPQPAKATHVAKTTKRPSLALLSAFDSYAKEQGIKPTTSIEWRAVIQGLIAFLGHDDLTRITLDDLIRWRDHLLQEITKRGSQRDPRTVRNGYFTPLKATLNWALQNQLIVTNPAEKLTIRVPRKAALRERNFDHSEIRKILSATLASPSSRISEGARLARRWIPWLCAYTGARVNEISQLRSKDIHCTEGIWNIRITPEAGTVKNNVARIVPLHPHLIEQGFVSVKDGDSEMPIFYDPGRSIGTSVGNRHFKKVGERLRDWVRDEIGITDPLIQPNHAWRHTFKTRCIDAGIPERIADAIQGHAPRSVGQSYGSVSLEAKAKAIASLPRFEIASPE